MVFTSSKNPSLFIFGCGYVAQCLSRHLLPQGWSIFGTTRSQETFNTLKEQGISPLLWDGKKDSLSPLVPFLQQTSFCLVSTPPFSCENKDAISLPQKLSSVEGLPFSHLIYLSSTSVYGDHGGQWVNEETSCNPLSEEGKSRLKEEESWHTFSKKTSTPVTILRLSAIYGPGRNTLQSIVERKPIPITKQGHFFNRIHVQDITRILEKILLSSPKSPLSIYNGADTCPSSYADTLLFGYTLLKQEPPLSISFEDSSSLISPEFRKYFLENRQVDSKKIQKDFSFSFLYPSYKEGLESLIKEYPVSPPDHP